MSNPNTNTGGEQQQDPLTPEQMLARIQEQEASIQQWRQAHEALQQQHAALQAEHTATQGTGGGHVPEDPRYLTANQVTWMVEQLRQQSKPKVHVKEPDVFTGKGEAARNFLLEIDLYMRANAHQYADDRDKVILLLSYCKEGTAASWREHIHNTATLEDKYPTFDDLKANFIRSFITTDDKGEAMRQLQELKQTGSLDDYIQKFLMLISRAQITDFEASKSYFVKGLGKTMLDKISWQSTLPTDMPGWYALVRQLDQTHRYIQSLRGGHSASYSKAQGSAASADVPMEIDALRLSKEDRERFFREGRCFQCGKEGHISKDCPTKRGQPRNPQTGRFQRQDQRGGQQSKFAQARALLKDLSTEERKKILEENKATPAMRIRAMIQELPEGEKEQMMEEIVSEDFTEGD